VVLPVREHVVVARSEVREPLGPGVGQRGHVVVDGHPSPPAVLDACHRHEPSAVADGNPCVANMVRARVYRDPDRRRRTDGRPDLADLMLVGFVGPDRLPAPAPTAARLQR
jgi:hypothetical protein